MSNNRLFQHGSQLGYSKAYSNRAGVNKGTAADGGVAVFDTSSGKSKVQVIDGDMVNQGVVSQSDKNGDVKGMLLNHINNIELLIRPELVLAKCNPKRQILMAIIDFGTCCHKVLRGPALVAEVDSSDA